MRQPNFHFYRMWHDEKRQLWVERYSNTDLRLARQYHDEACQFGWRMSGQHDRIVSDLYGDDGTVKTTIARGKREDEVELTPRTFHERLADVRNPTGEPPHTAVDDGGTPLTDPSAVLRGFHTPNTPLDGR